MVENIWNGQIRVEVCPDAEWKGAPFAGDPLTIDAFNVTSDDFDAGGYAQDKLQKNVLTWSFFALSLLFFLLYLLWRFFRACCVVCCCVEGCDARREKNADLLWNTKSTFLKVCLILTCLTSICLAAYSASNLEITLSEDAWNTIHAVRDTVENVLDTGDSVVDGLEGTLGAVQDVVTVIDRDVNVTLLGENIQCISDFLVGMPDLTALQTSISSLDTLLTTTLSTELDLFTTRLNALSTGALADIRGPVATLQSSETWFTDFNAELQAVNDAIAALETTYADPAAAEASARSLQDALDGVRDVSDFVDDLEDLKTDLNTIAATDISTQISDVESSLVSVPASITAAKTTLTSVETQLQDFETEYETAAPCIASFSARISTIGEDVIELPTDVTSGQDQLDTVTEPLEDFFGPDSSTVALFDSMEALEAEMDLPDTTDLENELDTAEADIAAISSDAAQLVTDINVFIAALNAFSGPLDTLESKLVTYLMPTLTQANYDDMRSYATTTFLPLSSNLVTTSGDITSDFATTFDSAESMNGIESNLNANLDAQRSDLANTQALIDGLPDLSALVGNLNDAATAYAALGPDPSSILTDAQGMLSDIEELSSTVLQDVIDAVFGASEDARSALDDARSDSVDEIDAFEADNRGLKFSHFLDTPEDVGFALLADDVNKELYKVTLCFYCVAIGFCLALMLFVMLNCQFGIGLTVFFFLIVIIFYYLIALLSSTILSVENDICANLEEIAIQENSDARLDRLLRYYLTSDGTLRSLMLEAFELDFTELEDQARSATTDASSIMDDWGTKGALQDALESIPASVDTILLRIAALEESFEYENMHPLYRTIKSFFCCDIPSFLFTIWKDLTTTGALSLFAILLGFLCLHRIDKMPRVDCCGCTCRRRYLDDILTESEEIKVSKKRFSDERRHTKRKGTQIGTEVV